MNNMTTNRKIYYGEYRLSHWINLLLKQNIKLPPYQRTFVWDEERVQALITTLKNEDFVPPVTIGKFDGVNNVENLILDGQQRLTSVFLAYLGLFHKKDKFKEVLNSLANENDDEAEPEESGDNFMEWTLEELTKKGRTKEDILANVDRDLYDEKDWGVDEDFFKTRNMGFTYLVPNITPPEQQKYYSTTFRNINKQGKALLPQESRKSLYFLSHGYDDFFEPKLAHSLQIKQSSSSTYMDFVRYLSLLFQYHKDTNANRVARGFKQIMEAYYERFIYAVVNDTDDSLFSKFSDAFPDKQYAELYTRLRETITALEIPKEFTSIIDMDIYLFGLMYVILFEKKEVDNSRKEALLPELEQKIREFKDSPAHSRAPGALKYLRARITDSITIYQRYCR